MKAQARRSAVAWGLVVGVVLSPGCSLLFVKGPAERPPPAAPCTRSLAWPIVDSVLATASGAIAIREATRTDVDGYAEGFRRGLVLVSIASAVAWAGSAYYGYTRTGACREGRKGDGSDLARYP